MPLAACYRVGQDKHRPPRGGGRDCRGYQGHSGSSAPGNSAKSAFPCRQSAYRLDHAADHRTHSRDAMAAIGGRRVAGISSFGFSGTNAHVIIEEAPPSEREPLRQRIGRCIFWRCRRAIRNRCSNSHSDISRALTARKIRARRLLYRQCWAHPFRSPAGGGWRDQPTICGMGSSRTLRGESNPGIASGNVAGNGASAGGIPVHRPGRAICRDGALLYETSPVFRRALDDCAAGLAPHLERGLLDVLFAPEHAASINDTDYAQPATFAIEYALAELWRSWGIEPAAVLGHSLGEYAAACVAGMLPLGDALRLVAERGRLTHALAARDGAMGAVFAPYDVVAAEITRSQGALTIAAYNGPEHFVISGDRAAEIARCSRLEAAGCA